MELQRRSQSPIVLNGLCNYTGGYIFLLYKTSSADRLSRLIRPRRQYLSGEAVASAGQSCTHVGRRTHAPRPQPRSTPSPLAAAWRRILLQGHSTAPAGQGRRERQAAKPMRRRDVHIGTSSSKQKRPRDEVGRAATVIWIHPWRSKLGLLHGRRWRRGWETATAALLLPLLCSPSNMKCSIKCLRDDCSLFILILSKLHISFLSKLQPGGRRIHIYYVSLSLECENSEPSIFRGNITVGYDTFKDFTFCHNTMYLITSLFH